MLPEELYKRRHYGTPEVVTLISVNFIVFALAVQMCVTCSKINWFFWVILAGLAWYNYYTIRRNREEFAKTNRLIFVVSVIALAIIYYLLAYVAQKC